MKLKYSIEKTKYIVEDYWEYKLKLRYNIRNPFDNGEIFLTKKSDGWYIGFYAGARTDGVTSWFDNKFLLKASFGHDILCNLIEYGAIAESDNNKIDTEFNLMILENNRDYPWYKGGCLVKWVRARLAMRGTNLANSKLGGHKREIFEI